MTTEGIKFTGAGVLEGENYSTWVSQLEAYLKLKKLWRAIEPGAPVAADATEDAKEAWEDRRDSAYSTIFLTSSIDIQAHIRDRQDRLRGAGEEPIAPKDLLAWLKKEYEPTTEAAKWRIREELKDKLANPDSSMKKHIGDLAQAYGMLARIGCPVEEGERCYELLRSLPDEYQFFVVSNRGVRNWEELRSAVLEEERRLQHREAKMGKASTDKAFAVGNQGRSWTSSGRQGNHGSNGARRTPMSRSGSGQSREQPTKDPTGVDCWTCSEVGHFAKDCPEKEIIRSIVRKRKARASNPSGERAAVAQETLGADGADEDHRPDDFGGMAFAVGNTDGRHGLFFLDTASSRHITNSRTDLFGYREAPADANIEYPDGGKMQIRGYGDMTVVTEEGNEITLRDVAYCPSAVGNLIGGRRLTRGGCGITFDNASAVVTNLKSGKVVLRGRAQGGGWIIKLRCHKERSALDPSFKSQMKHPSVHTIL